MEDNQSETGPVSRLRGISWFAFLMWPVLASAGAIGVVVGLGAAFKHAGNWSNLVFEFGVLCCIAAWVSNLLSLITGIIAWVRNRKSCYWVIPSAAVLVATIVALAVVLLEL